MKDQCESIKTTINPWSMGGKQHKTERCHKRGRYKVTQKSDKQSMFLCGECCEVFKKRNRGELKLYIFKKLALVKVK